MRTITPYSAPSAAYDQAHLSLQATAPSSYQGDVSIAANGCHGTANGDATGVAGLAAAYPTNHESSYALY